MSGQQRDWGMSAISDADANAAFRNRPFGPAKRTGTLEMRGLQEDKVTVSALILC